MRTTTDYHFDRPQSPPAQRPDVRPSRRPEPPPELAAHFDMVINFYPEDDAAGASANSLPTVTYTNPARQAAELNRVVTPLAPPPLPRETVLTQELDKMRAERDKAVNMICKLKSDIAKQDRDIKALGDMVHRLLFRDEPKASSADSETEQ